MTFALSCYTANLVSFLSGSAAHDLAAAVRLAVRIDPPGGGLAFSHHTRVDQDQDGRRLAYQGAPDWRSTRAALAEVVARDGKVLVVGDTGSIPWSPSAGRAPHWLLLARTAGQWLVADHFTALTPDGEQLPRSLTCDDEVLRSLLAPPGWVPPEVANRDRYALGEEVVIPPYSGYRWLEWAAEPTDPPEGTWVEGVVPALRVVSDLVCDDVEALERYADDLWAAAAHQRHRLTSLRVPGGEKRAAAWAELPRTVRFVLVSAARGRARPAMVEKALARVIDAEQGKS